jgi:hypothetical protein
MPRAGALGIVTLGSAWPPSSSAPGEDEPEPSGPSVAAARRGDGGRLSAARDGGGQDRGPGDSSAGGHGGSGGGARAGVQFTALQGAEK